MSTETLGEKLRNLRLEKKMPLRKVASQIDIDVAILSKMERGERKLTRPVVEKLASLYQHDLDELIVLYLSEKVLYELGDEKLALPAIQAAEEQVQYKLRQPREDKVEEKQEIIRKMQGYFQSQHLVTKAWIFGSFARGDDTALSDIDVMIDVPHETTFTFFDLDDIQEQLEKLTSKKVDVIMQKALRTEMKKRIDIDQQLIYEA
jgi:predicted nucleotidyltransferase